MSNYSEVDFCSVDQGLDYIFVYMGSIYGASFNRHWEGMELSVVRQVWQETLGAFLTYKPSLDFALKKMNEDYPPSAIKFRNLCNSGPHIPVKPVPQITRQRTQAEIEATEIAKAKAKALLAEYKRNLA